MTILKTHVALNVTNIENSVAFDLNEGIGLIPIPSSDSSRIG